MPAHNYECLFILDSNRYSRDPNAAAQSVKEMIEQIGGEILVSRLWAEQRLAYPIDGHQKGTYWLVYFRGESRRVNELNRICQLNDLVVRHLVTSVNPRLIDALVAHATGQQPLPTPDVEARKAVAVGIDDEEEELADS